jgi:crotonobetainyl-CoA:carnitine CoA-transferase CaiB-like acyl-CoA transferase
VKLEPPSGDSGRQMGAFMPNESKLFHALNRGKHSVVVDVQQAQGQALVHRLIPHFDVFLINAHSGTGARLRMDYATLRGLRADLIYLENSGFRSRGLSASRPGTDFLAQAYSSLIVGLGLMDEVGAPTPIKTTAPLDYTTGVTGALAICAALFQWERAGEGNTCRRICCRRRWASWYRS